jgi:hypothetical protein
MGILLPISRLFDADNSKKLFLKLFVGRIVFLIIAYNIFPNMAKIDFFATFGGMFLVSILYAKINNKRIRAKRKLNRIIKKSLATVSEKAIKDESPIVEMNQNFAASEKSILKNILIEEIRLQGENPNKFITRSLNNKKNILLLMMGLFTLICMILYFFNFTIFTCLLVFGIGLLVYLEINKRLDVLSVLIKQATKNPSEDISNLVKNIKVEKQDVMIPRKIKFALINIIAIILPAIFFFNPKIIYLKTNSEYIVFKYTRGITYNSEVTIPDTYKGLPVTAIGKGAFKNSNVKNVNLPNGLESIKTEAFMNCSNITEITIPRTVTEIRASAFENCKKLTTVKLNEGLLSIRARAFKKCSKLKEIDLPDTLEYLGAGAFSYCSSLVEVTIPKKVIELNGQTFEHATSLKKINLHNDIISIHGGVFAGCYNLNNVVLPTKITEIRGNTFENCTSLTSITIPEGVTRIGGSAFRGCSNLRYVSIPTTITEIGSSAFRKNYNLLNVRIPYGTVVNERAFKESPTNINWYYK